MGGLGFTEILLILVIVLVLFGGKKIPDLARALGKGLRDFRKASRDTQDDAEKPDKNTKQLP